MGLPEEPIATLLTFWGGVEQGFWAFNLNPEEYVKDIHCPVLQQWGAKDPRVTKEETEDIYKAIGTEKKKLVVYENAGHQSLYDKDSMKWGREVSSFMQVLK